MSIVSTAVKQIDKVAPLLKFRLAAEKAFAPVSRVALAHGPEILTGLGIVSGAATVVLASTATLKLEPIIDDTKTDLDALNALEHAQSDDLRTTEYKGSSFARDKTRAYTKAVGRVGKLYLPAIATGALSVGCILGAHGILRKRNAAVIAAYTALEKGYEMYRKRVIEEIGEDRERDIRFGFKDEVIKDKKTGETHTVTHTRKNVPSEYARFFDEGNENWEPDGDYNLNFLHTWQNYWNDRLKGRGYVFLNEVYESLGFEHTQGGQAVGWTISEDGDNFIDFNIYDLDNERKRMFVNGRERAILLDFNVDGVVWNKIRK
jgi:hypothetical protein